MAKSLQRIRREQLQIGLDGDAAPSRDPEDPRHRRSSAGAGATERRYNPDHFEVKSGGQVSLRIQERPRTQAVHLDFVGRHASGGSNPLTVETDAAGGVYASVVELFSQNDRLFMQWPIPSDLDRKRPITVEIAVVDRPGGTASTWELQIWAWEKGQSLDRAADKTLTESGTNAAVDVDDRVTFTIEPSVLTRDTVTLKFKLTMTSADVLGLHEVVLTYPVKDYHVHKAE